MTKHWCVNFESVKCLHHGIRNNLWLMGYQYASKGADAPARKAAITRNWRRLQQITAGDRLVAYLPGNKFFATATVIGPRRAMTSRDQHDTIPDYLKRGKPYTSGFVYFPPPSPTKTSPTGVAVTPCGSMSRNGRTSFPAAFR